MNYVNAYGEAISIGSRASHIAKPKSRAKVETGKKHLGFQAVGFSPEHIAAARAKHEEKQKDSEEILGDFNPDTWMNGAKKQNGQKKPFATPDAAGQLAEMLKRAGWVRVEVLELIR